MDGSKGIVYYTNNHLEEALFKRVQKQILKSGLQVVSVSLKPLNFGDNITISLQPSYPTMVIQILMGLEKLETDYAFIAEHDVLYHESHWDFTPPRDDIYYYNSNVWRWDYPNDRAITYDRLVNLSCICANRKLLVDHFTRRLKTIRDKGWTYEKGEPEWLRKMGYEPGTKKRKRGGQWDEDFETWRSEFPNIDIRHNKNFSPRKVELKDFKWQPTNFKEVTLNQISGWQLSV